MMSASPGPADASARAAQRGLALARVAIGSMFVWVFFENYGKGLYTPAGYSGLINVYIQRGRAPEAWKAVMAMAAAHAGVAAPLQAVAEISFGVLLVAGLFTRVAAAAAGLFLTSLWVSEWGTAWIWELLVPLWVAFAVAAGRGGRYWGIDAVLARKRFDSPFW